MAFYTRRDIGRVYVLRMILEGRVIHKVGMTHSDRSTDRLMEICRSWFTAYRYVPKTFLKLDIKCDNPQKLEKYIHRILKSVAYTPYHKVSGGTEMFHSVDETKLIAYIKAYTNGMYSVPPEISDSTAEVICDLLILKERKV